MLKSGFQARTRTLYISQLERNSRVTLIQLQILMTSGNGSCGFEFPLEIQRQVQVPLERHRHIFALRLERASKTQTGSSIT